jgi:pimeloyl-ACP methyl ester carboxylesterase
VRGWTGVWLTNDFRPWDLREELAYIRVAIRIIRGEDDHYGTVRQIEIAQEECYCPVEVRLLPNTQHAPHREAAERTLGLTRFASLRRHGRAGPAIHAFLHA